MLIIVIGLLFGWLRVNEIKLRRVDVSVWVFEFRFDLGLVIIILNGFFWKRLIVIMEFLIIEYLFLKLSLFIIYYNNVCNVWEKVNII